MFVSAISLASATGGDPGETDDEILADLRGATRAVPDGRAGSVRELTLEIDE
jgi:hypothetical protein